MKTFPFKARTNAIIFILSTCIFFSPVASAYTVYKLANNYYAIVCADGQIFSYSGGAGGIGIVGEALCEGHGGIAGGSGGDLTVAKASPALASSIRSCQANEGVRINASTTKCEARGRASAHRGHVTVLK